MTARQRRFWWVAGILGAVVAGVTIAYLWSTSTVSGRRWLTAAIISRADGVFDGRATLKIGTARELGWTRIQLDSVSLLDSAGVPVLQIAHVDGSLDFAALYGKHVRLRVLALTGVTVRLNKDIVGPWNLAYIISGDAAPRRDGPLGYADNIQIDSLIITDGKILTSMPWAPYPVFRGSARDSVIAVRDSLHDLTSTPQGFVERREITIARLLAHNGIITQPRGARSSLDVDSLRGVISDPPVTIVDTRGQMQWTPDSLWLALPHVVLPKSTGSAVGIVWWNQPGAVRYDVAIKASATFSDLLWIWDVLPPDGSGTANVRLRTLENADDAEYVLTDLDVKAGASRVAGRIAVTVRPAVFTLDRVNLAFSPLRAELLRRLSYDALPADMRGDVSGTLVAERGGSFTDFLIDRIDARFADAAVAGATSFIRASGRVNMGISPAARGVRIDTVVADLRSVASIAPALVPIDGILSGSMLIASADRKMMDARNVSLTWIDGVGQRSAVRGNARVGYGLPVPTVNAQLELEPLSFRALARVDTTLFLRSNVSGHVEVTGNLDSLVWQATLVADSSSQIVAKGTGSWRNSQWQVAAGGDARAFNARAWSGRTDMPVTALTGKYQVTAGGHTDSTGLLTIETARALVNLAQLEAPELPAFDVQGSVMLDTTRFTVDSATIRIGGVTMEGRGALARHGAPPAPELRGVFGSDTLEVSASADSLHHVRRQLTRLAAMIEPLDSASATSLRSFASDTLRGAASVSGYLVGSLDDLNATLALGARNVQFGALHFGRVFGSLHAENVLTRPSFEGVATADGIDGIGAVRIASSEFRVQRANPDSGQLVLNASSAGNSQLLIRGGYHRAGTAFTVVADSLRFQYGDVRWQNSAPMRVVSDSVGIRVDSLEVRSSAGGVFDVVASIPKQGDIRGTVELDRFPLGEAAVFVLGTEQFSGLLTGDVELRGQRAAPQFQWRMDVDSLGVSGTVAPRILSIGQYAERLVTARALIEDSVGGALRIEARVPIDLTFQTVEKRLLTDAVDADVTADSLRLEALKIRVAGVDRVRGALNGHFAVSGTVERPVATGRMELTGFSALSSELGIEPYEGSATVRAVADSLILESFRIRSGRASDTLTVRGSLRYAKDDPFTIKADVTASNFIAARQRNGNDLVLSGNLNVVGPLKRPAVQGSLFVPSATLIIDPLGASTALDLSSGVAREYLSASEIPIADYAPPSFSSLGQYASVSNLRVTLGNEVWVRTPESTVRLSGTVALSTIGEVLVPEGEIEANRGQYRLDLGVVTRPFIVDSGRVRFFGDPALEPTMDISATNIVRLSSGEQIPVSVHIGGTIEHPILTLSSSDPLYSASPESEIISLLIFGAPTFALDGQSQSTVRAVTGVLLPSAGGLVEGTLQRLLPIFNTVQVTTAGGQSGSDLNALSVLDNLSISAGKQIGERTFLRLNTGVCRGSGQSSLRSPLWAGVAVEYRLSRGFSGQIGYDPGSAPCSRLGNDVFPRMQFGFDLFRDWIF